MAAGRRGLWDWVVVMLQAIADDVVVADDVVMTVVLMVPSVVVGTRANTPQHPNMGANRIALLEIRNLALKNELNNYYYPKHFCYATADIVFHSSNE